MSAIEKKWAAKALAAEQRNRDEILDLPEMGGVFWTSFREVTQAMLDAWPIWEEWPIWERFGDRIQLLLLRDVGQLHEGSSFRPLRLPGMVDEKGCIAAKDMTPEHFERVKDWQRCSGPYPEWKTVTGCSMDDVETALDLDECWRPLSFAQLDCEGAP